MSSLCTCCRHYPGTATGGITLLDPFRRISLPRYGCQVGLCIVLFEVCSAFIRVTACTLALPPYFVARFTEGFSGFVTSTATPVASGGSTSPGGACTHWNNIAFSRRTPEADYRGRKKIARVIHKMCVIATGSRIPARPWKSQNAALTYNNYESRRAINDEK
jgi:hypothetical protein